MDTSKLLRQLADEFKDAENKYPDYSCTVHLPDERSGVQGPRIPRLPKYDPTTMIREVWEQRDRAYWRFKELAKLLYPLLEEAGAELITNEGATPDGSVILWAMGNEYPPPARIGVLTNDNPFWHVAVAMRQLLACELKSKGKRGRKPDIEHTREMVKYADEYGNKEAAEHYDVTPGAISQARKRLKKAEANSTTKRRR